MKDEIYIHSDESDEFIGRLMQTFELSFEELGLYSGMSFQELIDTITLKIGRRPVNDCTTQIVFYKVRQVMVRELGVEKDRIKNNARIEELFPKRNRKKNLLLMGKRLGIQMDYFQAPTWFLVTCTAALLSSLLMLFFSLHIGLLIFMCSLLMFFISSKLKTKLPMKTLRELVERITRDNLMKLRGDRESINPKEIKTTIINLIDDLHGLEKLELRSEQKILFG